MKRLILYILIAFSCFLPLSTAQAMESAYDRVMRTGTLHCGYFEEMPFTNIDPNTGARSGIAVDLAETITAQLGLKLEWTVAVSFASLVDDLKSGRVDAVCASVFTIPRAGKIDYTTPYIYVPSYGYVRQGDKRFDNNLQAVNSAKTTMAILDGEGSSSVALRLFPQAKQYALPQMVDVSQMLLAVADKKADIGFVLPSVYDQFNKANPGKLQKVSSKNPFYVFSVAFAVNSGEGSLKNMLDFMIKQLIVSGEMDRIIDTYESKKGMFLRVSKPYQQ